MATGRNSFEGRASLLTKSNVTYGKVDKETGFIKAVLKGRGVMCKIVESSDKVSVKQLEKEHAWNLEYREDEKDKANGNELRGMEFKSSELFSVCYDDQEGGALSGVLRRGTKIKLAEAANLTRALIDCYGNCIAGRQKCHLSIFARNFFLTSKDLHTTKLLLTNFGTAEDYNPNGEVQDVDGIIRILRAMYASMDEVMELGLLTQKTACCLSFEALKSTHWVVLCLEDKPDLFTGQELQRERLMQEYDIEFHELEVRFKKMITSIPPAHQTVSTPTKYKNNALGYVAASVDHSGESGMGIPPRVVLATKSGYKCSTVMCRSPVPHNKISDYYIGYPDTVLDAFALPCLPVVCIATTNSIIYHNYATNEIAAEAIKKPITVHACDRALLLTYSDCYTLFMYEPTHKILKHTEVHTSEEGEVKAVACYNSIVTVGIFVAKKKKRVVCKLYNCSSGTDIVPLEKHVEVPVTYVTKVDRLVLSDTGRQMVFVDGRYAELADCYRGTYKTIKMKYGVSMVTISSCGVLLNDGVTCCSVNAAGSSENTTCTENSCPIPSPVPLKPRSLKLDMNSPIFAETDKDHPIALLLGQHTVPCTITSDAKVVSFKPVVGSLTHLGYTLPPSYFKEANKKPKGTVLTWKDGYSIALKLNQEGEILLDQIVKEIKEFAKADDNELLPDEADYIFPPKVKTGWLW